MVVGPTFDSFAEIGRKEGRTHCSEPPQINPTGFCCCSLSAYAWCPFNPIVVHTHPHSQRRKSRRSDTFFSAREEQAKPDTLIKVRLSLYDAWPCWIAGTAWLPGICSCSCRSCRLVLPKQQAAGGVLHLDLQHHWQHAWVEVLQQPKHLACKELAAAPHSSRHRAACLLASFCMHPQVVSAHIMADQEASGENKPQPKQEGQVINLIVKDQMGAEVHFKVKSHTKLEKVGGLVWWAAAEQGGTQGLQAGGVAAGPGRVQCRHTAQRTQCQGTARHAAEWQILPMCMHAGF